MRKASLCVLYAHGDAFRKQKGITMRRTQKAGCGCGPLVFVGFAVGVLVLVFVVAPMTEKYKTLPDQPEWYQRLGQNVDQLQQNIQKMVPWSHQQSTTTESGHHTTPLVTVLTSSVLTVQPTITAQYIDSQLCSHQSPACGTGQSLYDLGKQYGIDPAFALAFFWHESNYGVNGVARVNHSLSNMRCVPAYACNGGYAYFPSWQAGYKAWYALIRSKVYVGGGRVTVAQIIPTYAPASDHNDPTSYINAVQSSVNQYRSESK